MARHALAALSVLLLAALLAGADAQDAAGSRPDWLGNPPPNAPGVEMQAWFPNHPRLQFPLGETIDVVVGFSNGGEETYNLTAVVGSLHSNAAWKLWVQNFTGQPLAVTLKPGEQASVEYKFRPDPMLQPREFLVAVHVFYQGLTTPHHGVAFNKTVDIIEPPKWIDFELIGLNLTLLALLSVAGYFLWRHLQSIGWVRAATKRRAPKTTSLEPANSADPAQWLKGTQYDALARAKAKRAASQDLKKAT